MRSLEAYRQTFAEIQKRHRWSKGSPTLRIAALALAGVPGPDAAAAMDRAADVLREKAGFWNSLNSPVRTVLAAMILRRGLDPAAVHDAMTRTVAQFEKRGLSAYGIFPKLAALVLTFRHGPETPAVVLDRMHGIQSAWVRDHFWLTGQDDLPMAALHASRSEAVPALTQRLEDIYGHLVRRKFSRGNALQLASHILGVRPWDGARAAGRFGEIADALERKAITVGRNYYDEIAVLALADASPERIAAEVKQARDVLWNDVGWTARELAFPLAAGCFLAEQAAGPDWQEAHEIAATKQVLDILAAQAAMVAVCCVV